MLKGESASYEDHHGFQHDQWLRKKIEHLFIKNNQSLCRRSIEICQQKLEIVFSDTRLEAHYFPALKHLASQKHHKGNFFSLFVVDVATLNDPGCISLAVFLGQFFAQDKPDQLDQESKDSHFWAFEDHAYYYNHAAKWGVWFVYQHQRFSAWHFANPFRSFLYDWLLQEQYQLLHASAISDGRSAILFTGPSGSGKSTIVLLALQAGYRLLGDDHCAVSVAHHPSVFSLYNAVKLDRDFLLKHFHVFTSHISAYINTVKTYKAIVNIADVKAVQMIDAVPIKAIVSLSFDQTVNDAKLALLNKKEALKVLSLTTIEQCLWVSRKKMFANIQDVIARLPCYQLIACSNSDHTLNKIRDIFHDGYFDHHSLL